MIYEEVRTRKGLLMQLNTCGTFIISMGSTSTGW
jgi:hypothetical protein